MTVENSKVAGLNQRVDQIFGERIIRWDERVAIKAGDHQLRYSELDRLSNRLARRLIIGGVQKGGIVAVATGNIESFAIAVLAILKAGGAYLAVDTRNPVERVRDRRHGHFADQERDYRKVLKEIEGLMSAKRKTLEGDRLDVLVTLVEAWERKHYPMDLPDPVEAIKYHMDQNGLQPRDLIPFIGSRNRVHEVLNRRRSLTLKMIWRLHEGLGIPAESLIKVG
jgi:HTH-type transcriptional regulator/antitoxin HigA